MGKITMTNVTSSNNGGDGVRIEGDIDVDIDGLVTEGNGGEGLNITQHQSVIEQLGLPKDTDPMLLAELLNKLQEPASNEQKETIIVRSRLGQFLREQGINITTIAANLLTIASNPSVQQLIQALSKGL